MEVSEEIAELQGNHRALDGVIDEISSRSPGPGPLFEGEMKLMKRKRLRYKDQLAAMGVDTFSGSV